jgi:hypothetical protein
MAGALHRRRQDSLVAGACAGLSPRANPPVFGGKTLEQFDLLVVNRLRLLGAELADADAAHEAPATTFAAFVAGGHRLAFVLVTQR